MSGLAFRTAGFSGLALSTGWVAVALALATLLPPEDASVAAAAMPLVERRTQATSMTVSAVDPCTSHRITVEASLVLDIARQISTGRTDVDIRLERAASRMFEGASAVEGRIDPLNKTILSGAPNVYHLRTPLAAPHATLDLLVELQRGIDDRGETQFWVVTAQIDGRRSPCFHASDDLPAQPIT